MTTVIKRQCFYCGYEDNGINGVRMSFIPGTLDVKPVCQRCRIDVLLCESNIIAEEMKVIMNRES